MSTGPGLESLVDQTISVITNDGRNIVGILKGFDQATNIILDESHERVYSTKALEPAWITARQIEAGRRAMTRYARRGGKIWVRIFPDKPVTVRPTETRMGSGKGSPEYWVSVVKPGRIIYEMSGVSEAVAKAAMEIAACKMPIRTQFVISG
ncbi:50S ribosomal protein L16, chloroplastic isoform X1 [Phalaenopsis equestris]|uniref:50S ribosomal protein L16, chloroplastic isoform X1 n=1 Tax=Phalaenopsis equestris TaxID=78828 RepID=UPI0009E2007B|nr:50S ribosomal protein L16, chloroplastic isoform X1 [Phalaenopsis equestris]